MFTENGFYQPNVTIVHVVIFLVFGRIRLNISHFSFDLFDIRLHSQRCLAKCVLGSGLILPPIPHNWSVSACQMVPRFVNITLNVSGEGSFTLSRCSRTPSDNRML